MPGVFRQMLFPVTVVDSIAAARLHRVVGGAVMRRVLSAVGVLSAAFATATAAPAAAADMTAVPRVATAATSWTGFYIGLSVGDRWTRADWNTLGFDTPGFGFAP